MCPKNILQRTLVGMRQRSRRPKVGIVDLNTIDGPAMTYSRCCQKLRILGGHAGDYQHLNHLCNHMVLPLRGFTWLDPLITQVRGFTWLTTWLRRSGDLLELPLDYGRSGDLLDLPLDYAGQGIYSTWLLDYARFFCLHGVLIPHIELSSAERASDNIWDWKEPSESLMRHKIT